VVAAAEEREEESSARGRGERRRRVASMEGEEREGEEKIFLCWCWGWKSRSQEPVQWRIEISQYRECVLDFQLHSVRKKMVLSFKTIFFHFFITFFNFPNRASLISLADEKSPRSHFSPIQNN